MTSRRSLQTNAARTSRQTQFVPGHVGGRVASAQPVQRRRTVGQLGRLNIFPTSMSRILVSNQNVAAPAIVSVPVGSSALVVVGGFGATALTAPPGWTVLTQFTETAEYLIAAVIDAPLGLSGDFDYDSSGTFQAVVAGYRWAGGSGGSVHYSIGANHAGPVYGGLPVIEFADPDPTWDIRWQDTFASAVWTGLQTPLPNGYSAGAGAGSFLYAYPGYNATPTATTAAEVESNYGSQSLEPSGNVFPYGTIGTYGPASSQSFALGWTAT